MMPANDVGRGSRSLPLPVFLTILSLFVLIVFETGEAIHEHATLSQLRHSQETAVQQSVKVREQLKAMARQTAQLAADGDQNAKAIVDQMKRRGVTLSASQK